MFSGCTNGCHWQENGYVYRNVVNNTYFIPPRFETFQTYACSKTTKETLEKV